HIFQTIGNLHASPAAAMRSLDYNGQAMLLSKLDGFLRVRDGTVRAGYQGRANLSGNIPGRDLVAELFDDFSGGTNPGQASNNPGRCKYRALGEKAVTRVDGFGSHLPAKREDFLNVQIRDTRSAGAQAVSFCCLAHKRRLYIIVGINRD